MDKVKSFGRDEALAALGLEVKRTNTDYLLPAFAIFGVGLLFGGGLGLLFAPRPGRELREDLAHRIQAAPQAIRSLPAKAAELTSRWGNTFAHSLDGVNKDHVS